MVKVEVASVWVSEMYVKWKLTLIIELAFFSGRSVMSSTVMVAKMYPRNCLGTSSVGQIEIVSDVTQTLVISDEGEKEIPIVISEPQLLVRFIKRPASNSGMS